MSALWLTATRGPATSRIAVWLVIVIGFALSSLLPGVIGVPVRIALFGVVWALIAAALAPYQSRPWQIGTRVVLAVVWVYTSAAAILGG